MKYLKLFESFTDLVNELTYNDFIPWCNDHKIISVDQDDESKIHGMIYKNTDYRGFATTEMLPSDFERSKPRIRIESCRFNQIRKSRDIPIIFIKTYATLIYLLKYDDDYWACIYSNSNEYLFNIIDGDEGLQKYFDEL